MAAGGLIAVDREDVVDGRPRRYFRITDDGVAAVTKEAARMAAAASIVRLRPVHP
jgi:DNA-binding PadR family transcriptional regulator